MKNLGKGIRLFNTAHFWSAHEAWEADWLTADGDDKRFLQGLIQLAAAYHHVQRGNARGASRLFDAAVSKLERFADGYAGVGFGAAVAAALQHRKQISNGDLVPPDQYPLLRYN